MKESDAQHEEPSMESTSGGRGEVHARISTEPDKGEEMSGKFDTPTSGPREFTRRMRAQAEDAYDRARTRTSDLRDRAGSATHSVRDRAGHLFERAEETLESRTGVLGAARAKPMAAVGVAFAIGFLLAGEGEEPERPTSLSKAKNQIKGAIMGGVSAAISQQLRTFIEDQGGVGALLSALGVPLPGGRAEPAFTPDDELRDL